MFRGMIPRLLGFSGEGGFYCDTISQWEVSEKVSRWGDHRLCNVIVTIKHVRIWKKDNIKGGSQGKGFFLGNAIYSLLLSTSIQ